MKRTSIFFTLCLFVSIAGMVTIPAKATKLPFFVYETNNAEWTQSSSGTWPAMKDGITYWYKLDNNGSLWSSTDGKKWNAAKEQTWVDKEGHWLKIHEKKLVWSTDGKAWTEVPEWKWMGANDKWYKFDSNWKLWVNG